MRQKILRRMVVRQFILSLFLFLLIFSSLLFAKDQIEHEQGMEIGSSLASRTRTPANALLISNKENSTNANLQDSQEGQFVNGSEDESLSEKRRQIDQAQELEEFARKKIDENLKTGIEDEKLLREGLVSPHILQMSIVTLAPVGSNPEKGQILFLDTPLNHLDNERKQRADEAYFQATLKARSLLVQMRAENGYGSNLPREIRNDLFFLKGLQVVASRCDPMGNCLFIYHYHYKDLNQKLKSPFD